MKQREILVADLFCGAGGTSTGAQRALEALGYRMRLKAVNHSPIAIETHQRNHPAAEHYCVDLDAVRPLDIVPRGFLHLLLASPECTHHSRARGGRPINDQSRMSAWHVLRWASDLFISRILIENVKEFREWGPLDNRGRPLKSAMGRTYQTFLQALRDMGYRVEEKVLCAADYGDATTRERLFIQARRDRRRIVWPVPTHSKTPGVDLFGNVTLPWRAAREVIDWSVQGRSIFDRKIPLRPKTINRIAAGLQRFGGAAAAPFLIMLYGTNTVRSVDQPIPTVTAGAGHIGLVEPSIAPFITPFYGEKGGVARASRSVDDPLATITTNPRFGLAEMVVEPFMLGQQSCAAPRSVRDPVPTVSTAGSISLIEPFITAYYGEGSGLTGHSIDSPLDTITTRARFALVEPFIVPQFGERKGQTPRTHAIDDPLPAVTSHGAGALVEAVREFLHENDAEMPSSIPPDGQGGRLVRINGCLYRLDIRFRMLRNHELARAMSFSDEEATYEFAGNQGEITKQIGNAVPVRTAAALISAIMQ